VIRAHLVLSESARASLASAGISTAWLSLWIKSAGAEHVAVHALNDIDWGDELEAHQKTVKGWIVVVADDVDLMRVALAHGKRISADKDGQRTILGSDSFSLINPERSCWFYKHDGSRVLLMSPGDVAYQRFAWLGRLNGNEPLLPALVSTNDHAGDLLEPALYGMVVTSNLKQHTDSILNDSGYLPEEQLVMLLRKYRMSLRCAESCTAGGVTARISRLPGASDVLEQGWVTYSNASKQKALKVPAKVLKNYGAVSQEVVEAMAKGCGDDAAAIAISGIAGPDGGTDEKPVGTVWIAVALPGKSSQSHCFHFTGSRTDIQSAAVVSAISMLIEAIDNH